MTRISHFLGFLDSGKIFKNLSEWYFAVNFLSFLLHFTLSVEAFLGNFSYLLMNHVAESTGDFRSAGVRNWLEEDLEMEPMLDPRTFAGRRIGVWLCTTEAS